MIQVAIIMGSSSDFPVMKAAKEILDELGIDSDVEVVSAHRTPEKMMTFAKNAASKGYRVIIAGAGGAAHLPGMVASLTTLPVIGVPIKSSNSIDGWDSILSILQMPNGIPVATVALNASKNAGILAARILSISDSKIKLNLENYAEKMKDDVEKSGKNLY
ncbi:MAG: 5-(carboxyamino)imidazole ribonucleotide mutase [Flavobacteriia bacterium]|nr:5-(carboxyamino)imidazole ribonucleotide mutase [Flavobacteriia bacterium]